MSELYQPSNRRLLAKLVPTFAEHNLNSSIYKTCKDTHSNGF
jgi:hypothetical protein